MPRISITNADRPFFSSRISMIGTNKIGSWSGIMLSKLMVLRHYIISLGNIVYEPNHVFYLFSISIKRKNPDFLIEFFFLAKMIGVIICHAHIFSNSLSSKMNPYYTMYNLDQKRYKSLNHYK